MQDGKVTRQGRTAGARFPFEQRTLDNGMQVIVHPECPHGVVDLADGVGSTAYLVKYCNEAPPGSTIAIGTEINLTNRMALEHPDKTIFELSGETCPVCANTCWKRSG